MLRKKKPATVTTVQVTAEQIIRAMAEELERYGIQSQGEQKRNLDVQEILELIQSGKIGTAFLTDELGLDSLDLAEFSVNIEVKVGIDLGAESDGMLDPRPNTPLNKLAQTMAEIALADE